MATVAVLGTGLLGAAMAENLLKKGNVVRVWNRSADKLAPLVAMGAVAAATPAEALQGVERAHLILAEDTAVDTVLQAAEVPAGLPILDHSTNQPNRVAERYQRLRASGILYFHAPVFMSPANGREEIGRVHV